MSITEKDVLYEDNHLIAINKRSGDIVQVDETGDEPLDEKVKKYIASKYHKPNGAFLGVVHRLDRPVFQNVAVIPEVVEPQNGTVGVRARVHELTGTVGVD